MYVAHTMKNNIVLFVDDDAHIISSLKRGLLDETYTKKFAYSGHDALKIIEQENICVIVTDMRMPKMSGLTLLKIIDEKYPNIVKIVLSGYTQLPQILATINQVNIFKFITKPWNLEDELIPIIRQAIEYANLAMESAKMRAEIERKNTLYTQILKSTNEKFSIMHKDYENIKNINHNIFNYLKSLELKKVDIPFNNYLSFIDELHSKYMDTLPTINTIFNLEKIMTTLTNYISQNHSNNTMKITLTDQNNIQFNGNYILLTNLLTTFIKHAFIYYNTLNMTISTKEDNHNITLFFIIELSQISSIEKDITYIIPILNHFFDAIDGRFEIIKEKNNDKVLSLKITF